MTWSGYTVVGLVVGLAIDILLTAIYAKPEERYTYVVLTRLDPGDFWP